MAIQKIHVYRRSTTPQCIAVVFHESVGDPYNHETTLTLKGNSPDAQTKLGEEMPKDFVPYLIHENEAQRLADRLFEMGFIPVQLKGVPKH